MHKKARCILIGAVLLLDLQSFAALARHIEERGAYGRSVSSARHCGSRQAGVLWKVLVERGVNLMQ
jgi:hypothetical protein